MGSSTIRVTFPQKLVDAVRQAPRGEGDFPVLVKEISDRLHGSVIEVDTELRERIEHYAFDFLGGRWQNLLREVVEQIEAAERAG